MIMFLLFYTLFRAQAVRVVKVVAEPLSVNLPSRFQYGCFTRSLVQSNFELGYHPPG